MMKKEFIPFDTVRNNAIKLAARIHREFGVPDIIYVSLRGGAAMGNVISEYFQLRSPDKKVLYAAVVAKSYNDIFVADPQVTVEGWTRSPDSLRSGDKILLVDDIFDTGRTVNHLVRLLVDHGMSRADIAVAVHDYKFRTYDHHLLAFHPDFYCRRHVIHRPEDDFWIHYLSHELKSLTREEVERYYLNGDGELHEALTFILNPKT